MCIVPYVLYHVTSILSDNRCSVGLVLRKCRSLGDVLVL